MSMPAENVSIQMKVGSYAEALCFHFINIQRYEENERGLKEINIKKWMSCLFSPRCHTNTLYTHTQSVRTLAAADTCAVGTLHEYTDCKNTPTDRLVQVK